MSSRRCFSIMLALVMSALVQPSFAGPVDGIVFEQSPGQLGGPSSDTEFISTATALPAWQQLADNIVLESAATLQTVKWWGFYGGSGQPHDPPDGPETMRIRFYGARPADALPDDDDIIFEESFLNPSRTSTGDFIAVGGLPDEFFYEVDLYSPLTLEADTLYWLEIVQVGDIDSHFRWETGFGLVNQFAFINGNVSDWQSTSGSLAFQLLVPEPETGIIVITGAMLVARRPARRSRRQ